MKKSILLFILIALTVLLASCYQDEVIDFRDKTENFRCEVTVEETNEHYFIYGEDAEYLMSLCKKRMGNRRKCKWDNLFRLRYYPLKIYGRYKGRTSG